MFDLVVKHILPGMGLFFYFVLHFNCKFAVDNKEYKNLFNGFYTPFGGPTDYLTLRQRNAYASLAEHQVFQKGKIIHSVNNFSTNHAEFNIEKPINGEIDIPV